MKDGVNTLLVVTKEKLKKKINTYSTADPKQSMGKGRPCRSNSFAEFPPMTSSVKKIK